METIKLEKSGNFMWVTDLKTNTTTRFPAKDTYYAFENKDKVLVLTWDKNNGETYHRYNVSELVDLDEELWVSFSALDTFLASNLGFNGGGGTSGTTQNLSETLDNGNATGGFNVLINDADAIELENTSSLKKGTYNFGGNGGISRICSNQYEDMWQNGFRHVFDQSGFIRHSTNCFSVIPDETFDDTLRFGVGSLWTLDDGTTYRCTDNTTGAAVWELYYSSASKYKVYTALSGLQSGGSNPISITSGNLTIGVTYLIKSGGAGGDFINVGAPNNDPNTSFVAIDTTPDSWGTRSLEYNTGALTVTALENTIGNIWFTYTNAGEYKCNSDGLFTSGKTVIFLGPGRITTAVAILGTTVGSTSGITIYSRNTSNNGVDGLISSMPIEIRVYNK
jgi:hypothetical protein